MKRYNKNDIEFVDNIYIGTAAAFIGKNKLTGKKGVYKENGCMIGFTNEDVREKLVSQILKEVGIECAQIDLVFDEEKGKNACFSNYIINDDEKLVEPVISYDNFERKDKIEDYVEGYINGVKKINKDENFHNECRQNLYNYMYMASILDLYDIKPDNFPIIENIKTGENKICPWFDFGISLKEDAHQRKGPFSKLSTDEVLNNLFNNHYVKVENISEKVNETLTKEKIEELFSQEYVKETFEENELEKIKNRVISQLEKCNKLQKEKLKSKEQVKNNPLNWLTKLKQKLLGFKNIISGSKTLPPALEEKTQEENLYVQNKFQSECKDLTKDIKEVVYDTQEKIITEKEVVIDKQNKIIE